MVACDKRLGTATAGRVRFAAELAAVSSSSCSREAKSAIRDFDFQTVNSSVGSKFLATRQRGVRKGGEGREDDQDLLDDVVDDEDDLDEPVVVVVPAQVREDAGDQAEDQPHLDDVLAVGALVAEDLVRRRPLRVRGDCQDTSIEIGPVRHRAGRGGARRGGQRTHRKYEKQTVIMRLISWSDASACCSFSQHCLNTLMMASLHFSVEKEVS